MITYAKLGMNGRLGNQLFQLAALIGVAKNNDQAYQLPEWDYAKYFPAYKATLSPDDRAKAMNTWLQANEPAFTFNELTLDQAKDYNLNGYFQSEKNFEHVKDEVRNLFTAATSWLAGAQHPLCAVHVRRGDYVGHPSYYQTRLSYFKRAMEFIKSLEPNVQFYVFSDDMDWCKARFKNWAYNINYDSRTDIEDLLAMSACKHFICSNSSFSWWAAWLGEKPGSHILFPDKWLEGDFEKQNPTHDVLPDRWHKGAPAAAPIDLSDVTFTIPVMYDHPDRKANLDLCIHYLRTHFKTNIIVSEWKTKAFEYCKDFGNYMHYADEGSFHRTRMLNDMAMAAETPIVVNYDADVFIDREQLLACIDKLRGKKASACYPYDGRFFRVDRNEMYLLHTSMSVADWQLVEFPALSHTEVSYGGAIAWLKDDFILAGMENERMVSFGPEDYERYERAKKLGFVIERVTGPLYHLNHYVGEDSTQNNPHFAGNWKEYDFIKHQPNDRLKEYVESWQWRKNVLEKMKIATGEPLIYDDKFYTQINDAAMLSADIILPLVKKIVPFKTVLDVGCGQGAWGVNFNPDEYTGIDGDYVTTDKLLIDKKQFIAKDLSKKINLRKKFDLIISLEVAEHIPPQHADVFIDNITRHSDTVLFSAAIPGQGGNNHLNEQWQSWWRTKFLEKGFEAYDVIRPAIWNNKDIPYYYRQNIMLYSKKTIKAFSGILFDAVHPEKYEQLLKG